MSTTSTIKNLSYNDLSNKPALKTVATSGSYSDLSNKPTIPNQSNFLIEAKTSASGTCNSQAARTVTWNVAKTGYTPIAITGASTNHAGIYLQEFGLSGTTATVIGYNVTGAAVTNTWTVRILYFKNI